jgi:hypothetical protein
VCDNHEILEKQIKAWSEELAHSFKSWLWHGQKTAQGILQFAFQSFQTLMHVYSMVDICGDNCCCDHSNSFIVVLLESIPTCETCSATDVQDWWETRSLWECQDCGW